MGVLSTLAQYEYYYDDSAYTYTTSTTDSAGAAAAALIFVVFYFLFIAAIYVVTAIFLGKIFKKAGVASWKAWVPLYNTWKLLEIGGQQGFWAVLAIIPLVNIVAAIFMYIAMYNIGLKLQKEGIFVLLAIFLPIVWIIWLAVDKSTWDDTKGAPSLARPEVPLQPTAAPAAAAPAAPVAPADDNTTPPTPPATPAA